MTNDVTEQDASDDDFVIALTPIQIGVTLAIVIVVIVWIRKRRKTAD